MIVRTFFQVNTNGIISFIEPQNVFNPETFPVPGKFLISPYWADTDTRGIGQVYFTETTNASLLKRSSDIIQKATVHTRELSRFDPQWMLIATWYNVGYFSSQTGKVRISCWERVAEKGFYII